MDGAREQVVHILNFVGSLMLTWVAVIDWRAGFIVLEGAWAALSLIGILRGPGTAGSGK